MQGSLEPEGGPRDVKVSRHKRQLMLKNKRDGNHEPLVEGEKPERF